MVKFMYEMDQFNHLKITTILNNGHFPNLPCNFVLYQADNWYVR